MNSQNDSKEIVLFFGEIETPPFSQSARAETGLLLRQLQDGEMLSMPESRPMPNIGTHCHELRVSDSENKKEWRIIYIATAKAVRTKQRLKSPLRMRSLPTQTNQKTS